MGFSESGGHETWRNAKKNFSIFGPITILSVLYNYCSERENKNNDNGQVLKKKQTKRAPTIKKVVKMLKHFPDLLISYMGSFLKILLQ